MGFVTTVKELRKLQNLDKKKKKRKVLLTAIFVLVNLAVIIWTAYREFQGGQNAEKFRNIEITARYLLPSFLCLFLAVFFETFKYILVMKRTCGFVRPGLCLRTVLYGRYYDNITPSGIGGQPFQIYYLKKNGIGNAQSASIPIAGFLSMQFSFILLALLCVIFEGGLIESPVLRTASYIGIVCYSLFPIVILFFTFFPDFSGKVTKLVVSLLVTLRLVKDRQKTTERFIKNVEGYSDSLRSFFRSVPDCAAVMLLGLLYQVALCSIPYFVIRTFGGSVSYLQCFVTTVTIYAAITFIPTPGNAGAAEGVFYSVFSVLTKGYLFWAMLVWRFLVYYIYLIAGILLTIFDYVRSGKKEREALL